jgi:hypothetical protein
LFTLPAIAALPLSKITGEITGLARRSAVGLSSGIVLRPLGTGTTLN